MFFGIAVLLPSAYYCREPVFNQTFFNQTFINPGAAGKDTNEFYNVLLLTGSMLSGFEGAPRTTLINIDGQVKTGGTTSGLTINVLTDKAGFLRNTDFGLGYAYRIKTAGGSLGIGFSAGVLFSSLDPDGWRQPDGTVTDPAIVNEKSSKKSFDASLGLFYEDKALFAGISCLHLASPKINAAENASFLKPSFYFNGGYKFALPDGEIQIVPTVLIVSDLATAQYEVGVTGFWRNKFWAGLNYRFNTSAGILAGLNLFPELRLGYCYSYNTAILGKFSGNHELMLSYRFAVYFERGKQKYKSIRYL